MPSSDSLRANQVRLFRRTLAVGDSLSLRVEPTSGDADLWVWDPRGNSVLVRNASGTAVDEGSFTATAAGTYQIEVFAYSDTKYRLTISGGQAAELGVASAQGPAVQLNAEKTVRTAPVVAAESEPEGQSAVPVAPVGEVKVTPTGTNIYLPVLSRSFASGW